MFLFLRRASAVDLYTPRNGGRARGGVMAAKLRLLSAVCALVAAVIVVWQTNPVARPDSGPVQLRSTSAPMSDVSTTIKWPVIETVNPTPFDSCQDSLRCHYDAGNYQMAVESFVWRTYEQTLPADAVELDIDGHRAAQYWIMKPTDWNNRWWITCMIAFKTSYGVLQQSLFYSPIYGADDVDCLATNLQRARELAPYYKL